MIGVDTLAKTDVKEVCRYYMCLPDFSMVRLGSQTARKGEHECICLVVRGQMTSHCQVTQQFITPHQACAGELESSIYVKSIEKVTFQYRNNSPKI